MENTELEIEKLRDQLNENRITEFVESLLNKEDLDHQRYSLVSLLSKALNHLHQTEQNMLTDYLTSVKDVCPGCVIVHAKDLNSVELIVDMFNQYVSAEGTCDD